MKHFIAIAAILAIGAHAQIDVIKTALGAVSTGIESLDTAAQGFAGNIEDVKSKADSLVASIKKGKTTVDGSSDLTIQEALGLTDPVQDLTKKSRALLATFKTKRSDVEKAGACDTVRGELKDINDNSEALITSVVSKVPKDAQSIAKSLAFELTKVLAEAQNDFSETNCKNSGGAAKTGQPSTTPAVSTNTDSTSVSASRSVTQSVSQTASETPSKTDFGTTMVPSNTLSPTHGGNATATAHPPNVTAGASFLAPAGALALAIAAALL
ncbi:hypothetical protein E4U21_000265 [Claviceps maximensis]|nr:hypothetical protein E4U21_000265 [Claviceps maximensis]